MNAEFTIDDFKNIGGQSLLIIGKVESGIVSEGDVGRTFGGKKLAVVKIEKNGSRIPQAPEGEKVNLWVKYILPADIRISETLLF